MPIEGISDVIRFPRLGKIHLGVKVEVPGKNPYPKAVDYFVCPPEVQEVHGEKPKELPILFPVDDPEQFAQQWLRAYSRTQGLICIGNGETCRSKVDMDTGALASHATKEGRWEWRNGLPCQPQECEEYLAKHCRRVMNLQFLLPEVPGLGVWQIDTSSFYSIVNINNMVRMLRAVLGRCNMIPLTLALGPVEVSPPGQKKKTVYIMHLKKNIKLANLARLTQLPPFRVLIPEPEVEEPPEDLIPPEILEQAPSVDVPTAPEEVVEPQAPQRTRDSIRNLGHLAHACWQDFSMTWADILRESGYSLREEISDPYEVYRKIAAQRSHKPPGRVEIFKEGQDAGTNTVRMGQFF